MPCPECGCKYCLDHFKGNAASLNMKEKGVCICGHPSFLHYDDVITAVATLQNGNK
jgi:hypothetical protein